MNRERRMQELMAPIDNSILSCDNTDDILMLACAMMVTAKNIFDTQLGEYGRKQMFQDYVE